MIKAALIGWLKFLPLGQQASWEWGQLLMGLGSLTLLYALIVGLSQTNPKVVLAYSSVSKMGLMTAILGLALAQPELAPTMLTAMVFYAALHGLAKGALFLGVGVSRTTTAAWILPVLTLPAMVLAGAPFTAGALTKTLLDSPLAALEGSLAILFPLLLILSSLGTTLLLGRFLILMAAEPRNGTRVNAPITLPWLFLIGLLLGMPWVVKDPFPAITGSWPMALGALLVLIMALSRWRWAARLAGRIPAGDILAPTLRLFETGGLWITQAMQGPAIWKTSLHRMLTQRNKTSTPAWPPVMEQTLSAWPVAGLSVLLTAVALFVLLGMPG
jgi:formate hydrogenlyase subunit 3/multisubunit Na+/H+ antiporter MnhD subunit